MKGWFLQIINVQAVHLIQENVVVVCLAFAMLIPVFAAFSPSILHAKT